MNTSTHGNCFFSVPLPLTPTMQPMTVMIVSGRFSLMGLRVVM